MNPNRLVSGPVYITFNDPPSGIFYSQVTDVCKFLNQQKGVEIKLLSFISLRGYVKSRRKIKNAYSPSYVVPMFPGIRFWKINVFCLLFFCFFKKPFTAIGRGPYASWLALKAKKYHLLKRVVLDARGAYIAELNEYNVAPGNTMKNEIRWLEKEVVLKSDFKIAVSEKLVDYWRNSFGYNDTEEVIIPCTLGKEFTGSWSSQNYMQRREKMGISKDDILVAFSGSSSPWHSFDILESFIISLLEDYLFVKVLFLSKELPSKLQSTPGLNERLFHYWVPPSKVCTYLSAADYGLLIREYSVTNEVSSPVKFAEYLSCGLKVIISENLGDYSEFVVKENAGLVIKLNSIPRLNQVSFEEKIRMNQLAIHSFSKKRFMPQYEKIFSC